jgi:hypothetical protein
LAFGSGYVSQDLELAAGNYDLTEFYVQDQEKKLIYSTPREGSGLAKFVNDPLDIAFSVDKDASTIVYPQVLAVDDATNPGDFGYSSFAFDVVKVTAFVLPETSEKIVKVSYSVSDLFYKYEGDVIPENGVADLNNPKLNGRIWNAQITLWTESKDCSTDWSYSPYQKVYRLTTEMTFTGQAFRLPDLTSARWEPMYYRESRGIGYFFSADPRHAYKVEIKVLDESIEAGYSFMDRYYYNSNGGYTCDPGPDPYARVSMNGLKTGILIMKDKTECETEDLVWVDSYVAVNSNKGARHEHFAWTLRNGEMVPTCDPGSTVSGFAKPKERVLPEGF